MMLRLIPTGFSAIALVLLLVVNAAWATPKIRGHPVDTALASDALDQHLTSTTLAGPTMMQEQVVRDLLEERLLQTVPIPATRECGQVIGVTPAADVVALLNSVADLLFPADSPFGAYSSLIRDLLNSSITHDIQASVVCSSCEQVATTDLLSDAEANGFATYCGEDRYGYNVTHSGLLFLPVDPETGELVTNKTLKGSVFLHTVILNTAQAPSEVWPEDLATLVGSLPDAISGIALLYNAIGGMFAAGAGAIAIVPDYIGFGQSYQYPKSGGVLSLYQQSAVALWLGTQNMLVNTTGGCTEMDNAVTVAGYSEGGMAAFPVAQALDRIGVTILSCVAGAPVTDIPLWGKWAVDQVDQGIPNISVGVNLAYFGNAYSSTNPDLPNTNVGQDLLADEWMDPNNFTMNAKAWISSNLTGAEVAAYVPFPDYLQLLNPAVVEMFRNATMMNETNACSLAEVGVTDKICEAMLENSDASEIAAPTFPVVLCHSPNDDVIPKEGQFPNVTASANLTEFTVLGLSAMGNHGEAGIFCLFPMILPFTSMGTGPSAFEQEPIDSCPGVTPSPGTPPTAAPAGQVPTGQAPAGQASPAPTPASSGYRGSISVIPAVLATLVWVMS